MSCLMINDIDAGLGRFGELLFDLTLVFVSSNSKFFFTCLRI
jgi:hypothetical protein